MPNAPHSPADFDESMRQVWSATTRALRKQGTWSDAARPLVERYVRALRRAQKAQAIVDEQGPTAKGSAGQDVVHPALRVVREAEHDATEYETALLLTPRAKSQAGLSEATRVDEELEAFLR